MNFFATKLWKKEVELSPVRQKTLCDGAFTESPQFALLKQALNCGSLPSTPYMQVVYVLTLHYKVLLLFLQDHLKKSAPNEEDLKGVWDTLDCERCVSLFLDIFRDTDVSLPRLSDIPVMKKMLGEVQYYAEDVVDGIPTKAMHDVPAWYVVALSFILTITDETGSCNAETESSLQQCIERLFSISTSGEWTAQGLVGIETFVRWVKMSDANMCTLMNEVVVVMMHIFASVKDK